MATDKWTRKEIDNLIHCLQEDVVVGEIADGLDRPVNGVYHKIRQLKKGVVVDGVFIMYPFVITIMDPSGVNMHFSINRSSLRE
jgi:hypothetical protein